MLKVTAFELNNNYLGWQAIKFLIKHFATLGRWLRLKLSAGYLENGNDDGNGCK